MELLMSSFVLLVLNLGLIVGQTVTTPKPQLTFSVGNLEDFIKPEITRQIKEVTEDVIKQSVKEEVGETNNEIIRQEVMKQIREANNEIIKQEVTKQVQETNNELIKDEVGRQINEMERKRDISKLEIQFSSIENKYIRMYQRLNAVEKCQMCQQQINNGK